MCGVFWLGLVDGVAQLLSHTGVALPRFVSGDLERDSEEALFVGLAEALDEGADLVGGGHGGGFGGGVWDRNVGATGCSTPRCGGGFDTAWAENSKFARSY